MGVAPAHPAPATYMPSMAITITTLGTDIRLAGKLTTESVARVFMNTPEFTEPAYRVDLQEIDEIDSAGLALLVYWQTCAKASASTLNFTNPPKKLLDIAEIGGLTRLFQT